MAMCRPPNAKQCARRTPPIPARRQCQLAPTIRRAAAPLRCGQLTTPRSCSLCSTERATATLFSSITNKAARFIGRLIRSSVAAPSARVARRIAKVPCGVRRPSIAPKSAALSMPQMMIHSTESRFRGGTRGCCVVRRLCPAPTRGSGRRQTAGHTAASADPPRRATTERRRGSLLCRLPPQRLSRQ